MALLPWTKVVLAVSALVNFVLALILLLAPSLVHALLWPAPFEPQPDLWLRYNAFVGIALGIGAVDALARNNWLVARTVLLIAGVYVVLCLLLSLVAAVTPPGVPTIVWLYVLLALLYLPQLVWVWRQQVARMT